MRFLKATCLIVLTGVLAIIGLFVFKLSSPPPPASYTSNMWSIVQDQLPRKDLVVFEEQVVESIREHWRATPPLWRIPFGDWPGEAIVRIAANARHRQEGIRTMAEEPIIEFFDQYVLKSSPHLDASLPRRVVWERDESLAEHSNR